MEILSKTTCMENGFAFATVDRIKGVQIGVSDSLPTFEFSMDVCGVYNPPTTAGDLIKLECNKKGKYFILRLPKEEYLHIAEVDVYTGTVQSFSCHIANNEKKTHKSKSLRI